MKKYKNILIVLGIYFIDLITKLLVTNNLKLYGSKKVIKNFLYITYTKNKGAAFSLLENHRFIIIIISLIILFYILKELLKKKNTLTNELALTFILGGLISNLSDRLFLGYVRDFIDFRFGSFNFAIFNVGDIFIVIGCILYLIAIVLEGKNESSSNKR